MGKQNENAERIAALAFLLQVSAKEVLAAGDAAIIETTAAMIYELAAQTDGKQPVCA